MKVMVTGAKGFIGQRLVERLRKTDEVLEVDLKANTDIMDLNLQKCDLIYHLAGQTSVEYSVRHPVHDARMNILPAIKLARMYPFKKIIYTSSAATLDIRSPYGLSKYMAGEAIKLLNHNPVVCILPNLFGGGQGLIDAHILVDNPIIIYGDGSHKREFVHVDDIVEGLIKASTWNSGEYRFGNDCPLTVMECVKASGKPYKFEVPREGEIAESVVSNTTPNWKAKIDPLEYIAESCR